MIFTTIYSLLALASTVVASPATFGVRQNSAPVPDVVYPPASSGTAIWVIGYQHNITWTGGSGNGDFYLAKGGIQDTGSPLASGVDLSSGRIEISVPNVAPATDYTIVLSTNGQTSSSNQFTISQSKDNLPASASALTSGVTSVVFPSTTIVTSLTGAIGSITSEAAASASSAVSSLSAGGSSALSSLSAEASSVQSSLSAAGSSLSNSLSAALSSATAPSSSAAPSESGNGNSAVSVTTMDLTALKALVAVVAIAISAGSFLV